MMVCSKAARLASCKQIYGLLCRLLDMQGAHPKSARLSELMVVFGPSSNRMRPRWNDGRPELLFSRKILSGVFSVIA